MTDSAISPANVGMVTFAHMGVNQSLLSLLNINYILLEIPVPQSPQTDETINCLPVLDTFHTLSFRFNQVAKTTLSSALFMAE